MLKNHTNGAPPHPALSIYARLTSEALMLGRMLEPELH